MAESIKKFIIKDVHGGTKESGSFSVVGEVHVDIVPGYGEPTATSEYVNGVLTITISNIEGNGITEIITDSQEGDEAVNTITIKTNANPEGVTLEVRNGSQGPVGPQGIQGIPGTGAIWTGEGEEIMMLEQTTGNALNKAMSQKAVSDALNKDEIMSWNSVLEPDAVSKTYINSSGVWTVDNARNSCLMLPVTPGDVMRLSKYSPDMGDFSYGWLANTTVGSNGDTAVFVDGKTIPYYSGVANEVVVTVPEGAHCLYMRKLQSVDGRATERAPEIKLANKTMDKIDDIDTMHEDASSLTRIYTNQYPVYNKIVNKNHKWASGSDNNRCKLIPVKPGTLYKIQGQPNLSYHAFFVTDDSMVVGSSPSYAGGRTSMGCWRRDVQYIYAPADAAYLYCRQNNEGVVITPQIAECKNIKDVDRFVSERFLMQQARMVTISGKNPGTLTPALCLLHASDIHGETYAANAILETLDKNGDLIDDCIMTGDVVHYYASDTADATNYPNGINWWHGCGLPEKMMFTLGNHDGNTKSSTEYDTVDPNSALDGMGQAWDFENYFEPYIEGLGYVMPEGYNDQESPYYKACYWHKDYPAQKIRIIGLDVVHRFDGVLVRNGETWSKDPNNPGRKYTSDAQEQWLIERLNETLTGGSAAGYKVVICAHYPLDAFDGENKSWNENEHKWVCNWNENGGKVMVNGDKATNWHAILNPAITLDRRFCMRNRGPASGTKPYTLGDVNNVGNILEDFITRKNGVVIAWLCGHYHSNMMYYPEMFPNVLVIAVSQTGWYRTDPSIYRADISHERPCFNFVAIHEYKDTGNNDQDPARPRDPRRDEYLIRIVRIGCKADKALAPQNVLCYDWKRRKVISEW